MEYFLPKSIECEDDLIAYEQHIKQVGNPPCEKQRLRARLENNGETKEMTQHLKSFIGKSLRVDCVIGQRVQSLSGILSDVGSDCIVLKSSGGCCNKIVPITSVKLVTATDKTFKS